MMEQILLHLRLYRTAIDLVDAYTWYLLEMREQGKYFI